MPVASSYNLYDLASLVVSKLPSNPWPRSKSALLRVAMPAPGRGVAGTSELH